MATKREFVVTVVAVACCVPVWSQASAPKGENSPATKRVTLTATLPKRLIANEAWPTTISLHNDRLKPVSMWLHRNNERDVMVEVKNGDGEVLERTAYGERHLPGNFIKLKSGERVFIGEEFSPITKRLKPGESHEWKIELGKCFNFDPGEYTIEMSLPTLKDISKITHEMKIQVLPAKD